jgi:hypothetical protein
VNVPENAPPLGPVHVPPPAAVGPNNVNNGVAGLLMHKVTAASIPAMGGAITSMVTVELTLAHGGGTVIV